MRRPDPLCFEPDEESLCETLDRYDRCLNYVVSDDGVVTVQSGMYPHWRRFQRDLHGPSVNIQGHGYAVTHVHKRKMLRSEMARDDNIVYEDEFDYPLWDYSDKPETCIVTLTPIVDIIQEGIDGPEVRI